MEEEEEEEDKVATGGRISQATTTNGNRNELRRPQVRCPAHVQLELTGFKQTIESSVFIYFSIIFLFFRALATAD